MNSGHAAPRGRPALPLGHHGDCTLDFGSRNLTLWKQLLKRNGKPVKRMMYLGHFDSYLKKLCLGIIPEKLHLVLTEHTCLKGTNSQRCYLKASRALAVPFVECNCII